MNPPEWFLDGSSSNRPSPRKEVQLQGPRPAALKVNKDSHKIKKPPVAPNNPPQQHQSQPSTDDNDHRKPVIIYAVSPKVIHTTVTDFMNLVQRLTGNNNAGEAASSAGDVSPAARLASIEKAAATTSSPRNNMDSRGETTGATTTVGGNSSISNDVDEDIMGTLLQESDVELGRAAPGILSPAPGSLPPISPGFFSPAAADPFAVGNSYFNNMFVPSPSTLFSSPMVSPSPSSSSFDPFNPFFDF